MQKVLVRRAGGHDRLERVSAPDPTPGDGEVLLVTEAIGVNDADCVVRMGLYESARKYVGWPITPGFEVAGTIAAVGAGVDRARIGQRAFAITRFGGYATHVVVPEHQVFDIPARFTTADAAGFPGVFMTAYFALGVARGRAGPRSRFDQRHLVAGLAHHRGGGAIGRDPAVRQGVGPGRGG